MSLFFKGASYEKWFRLAATVILLISLTATVCIAAYILTPPPGTDTGDIFWKLPAALAAFLTVVALVWELMFYGYVMYFFGERETWSVPLTIFMALLTLGLLAFFLSIFGEIFFPTLGCSISYRM